MLGDGGARAAARGGVGAGGYVCVGENCPLPLGGAASVSVVSESVAEWCDASGRRGERDSRLLLAGAVGTLVRQENLSEPGVW
jgi:hypothetical protein